MVQPILPARPDDTGRAEGSPGDLTESSGPWRQPVVWLGVAIFLASLAGCVLMIVLALSNPDQAPPAGGDYIMKMPVNRIPAEPPK